MHESEENCMATPRTREKIISGVSGDIMRKGAGLGSGPVGNVLGYLGRPGTRGLKISSVVSGITFILSYCLLLFRPSGKDAASASSADQNGSRTEP